MIKKVLFPFVGDSVGGSHIATKILIKNLKNINYDFEVLIFKDEDILSNYFLKNNIKFTFLPKNKYKFKFFFLINTFMFLKNFIEDKKVKIIHTNDLRMHYFWSFYSFFFNNKHIWHQHSSYKSRRNILFSSFSDYILTVSDYTKRSFTKKMSQRAKVIGNPFNLPKDYSSLKVKNKKEKKIVLYIGNSNSQKRPYFFIDIAKNVHQKNKQISFHMLGEFNFTERNITELAKFNIKVFKKNYNIDSFLSTSDLLIAPGVNEGFGRTVVEAMLYKVPVLASNSGAHVELINHKTGYLADKDSLKDFSEKCLDILKQEKNSKKLFYAYNFCKTNFSTEAYIKKIKKVYDEISL